MTDIAKKALQIMYDDYVRTGEADWHSIDVIAGKQLFAYDLVTQNVQGEYKLTDAGIAYMSR